MFFRHLTTTLKTGLATLLEPATDPRTAFVDSAQRQTDLLARVREALAQNTALRRQLETRTVGLQTHLPKLEALAQKSLAANREDLARLALQQKQLARVELRSLEMSVREIQLEEGRLAIIEQRLTTQIESLRVRQEMAAVRYTAAESQVLVSEAISGISQELTDLGFALEQVEQKTEHLQARAAALDQLTDIGALTGSPSADTVEKQLVGLDVEKAVEEELAALRRSLNYL